MKMTPKTEINARISKFQERLAEQELDGAIVVLSSITQLL